MGKTVHHSRVKNSSNHCSSIARDLFQKSGILRETDTLRTSNFKLSNSNRVRSSSRSLSVSSTARQSVGHGKQQALAFQDENYEEESDAFARTSRKRAKYTLSDGENDPFSYESVSDAGESEEDEDDWLDGSTLLVPYQDKEIETEEDRTNTLVEYLQVPMQEKSQEIKKDLCDILTNSINEIRQTQGRVERGADIDRGKGIIVFNDACDKRHVNTSHAHADLEDSMSDNQAEIKQLFVQLKHAYARKSQLWNDLRVRVAEITKLQTDLLDQLDSNMARTIATWDKKGKVLLKDNVGKDKEKLLRGVLRKL